MFAAKPKQGPDTVADLLVGRKQLGEVTHLVQPLLVIADPAFHEQPRYTVLHLHHLPHHQVPVAQRTAPVPDLGRSRVALGKKIAAQAVGDLAGIDPVVLTGRGEQNSRSETPLSRMWTTSGADANSAYLLRRQIDGSGADFDFEMSGRVLILT